MDSQNNQKWWTKGIQSIISPQQNEHLDIFKVFPAVRRFISARRHYAVLKSLGDIFFVMIILLGLLGPQDPSRNISVFLIWGVLWPIMVLSWLIIGKMWCGVCPYPGLGIFFQQKDITADFKILPQFEKYGIYFSVLLLAATFWVEIVAGLDQSPSGTSLLLLAIVLSATFFSFLYKGRAWCRYLCPLGRISGVAATMAITEFRPDHSKCYECKTIACRKGIKNKAGCPLYLGAYNVRNNIDCLVCGHCLELCELDSPGLLLRNPFSELIRNKGRFITCTHIVPFLIGSQLARFFIEKPAYAGFESTLWESRPIAFSLLLAVGFLFSSAIIRLGNRMFTISEDPVFGKFSPMVPILVPMAIAGEFVYRVGAFTSGIGDFLPTLGRQFNLVFLERTAYSFPITASEIFSAFCIINAGIICCFVLWRFSSEDFEGLIPFRNFFGINCIIFFIVIVYLLLIF